MLHKEKNLVIFNGIVMYTYVKKPHLKVNIHKNKKQKQKECRIYFARNNTDRIIH